MSSLLQLNSKPANAVSRSLTVRLIAGDEIPAEVIDAATNLGTARLWGIGPFGRAIWWQSWWRHLRPRASELFLLTVWDGGELIGLAPWYTQRLLGYGRVVRFLGDGRACSDYATIVASPARRSEVLREIAHCLSAEAGNRWDAMLLEGVSAGDESMQAFITQLGEQNILVHQRAVSNTWRLALPESWEAYVESHSKQHRNRLRRMQREMLDSGRATLRHVSSAADFDDAFELQCRLHQERRRSLGDDGCFANPHFESFLRDACERFLEQGDLRLQWTLVDGEAIAFDSGFVHDGGVFVYQTAFDPAKSELSPGRLHFQAAIAAAIAQGFRFIDFLRGDEPYKAHLGATPTPILETRLIGPRRMTRLRFRCWELEQRVKDQIRGTSE